jgi:ribosome-binding factor A
VTDEPYAVHSEIVDDRAEITDLSDVDTTPDLSQAHNVEVYATIIRADGTVEDAGMVAAGYTTRHKAPLVEGLRQATGGSPREAHQPASRREELSNHG